MKNIRPIFILFHLVMLLFANLQIKNINDGSGFVLDKDGNLITTVPVEKKGDPLPTPGNSSLLFKHLGLGQNLVVIDSSNVLINDGGFNDVLLPDSGNIVFKMFNGSNWDWKAFGDQSIPTFRVAHSILTPDLNLLLPNHIRTYTYRFKNKKGKNESIQYADGYGRVVQTQAILNNYKSLISGTYFNENNAKYKVALPFASPKFGQYLDMRDEKLIDSANKYYSEKFGTAESFAYAETKYHNDPRGKVAAGSIPGSGFEIGAGHEIKSWDVGITSESGYFTYSELKSGSFEQTIANRPEVNDAKYVLSIARDRDRNFAQQIKNSKGELVLSWAHDGTSEIISKYEYDKRGNLLHKIMPLEVAGKGRCRKSYGYDTQDRLVWSVSPDRDSVKNYYNKIGRLDSTAAPNYTLIPEYDKFGRVIKSYVKIKGGDPVLLSRTYYDSKRYLDGDIFKAFATPEDLAIFKKIIGLEGKGEIKYMRGRSIATVTYNSPDEIVNGGTFQYKGSPLVGLSSQDEEGRTNVVYSYYAPVGWQKAVSTFDLQGNVLTTDTYHHYDPAKENTPVISIENVYDDLGRVVAVRDNKTKEKFVSYVFAETGEVLEKSLYGKNNSVIDRVTYTNNIRGQLKENKSKNYRQSLSYQNSYNGNVTSTVHNYYNDGTKLNQTFDYDGVNRLVTTSFVHGSTKYQDVLTESFIYDENGRFSSRTKNGQQWIYNYFDGRYGANVLGHQLKAVSGYHTDSENYAYDENGNMLWDNSKKMAITYNYQNMPVKFTFYEDTRDLNPDTRLGEPISEVEMVYNGAGTRLQKIERIFNDDGTITVNGKLYSGGFVYTATKTINDGEADNLVYELDYVNTPGGRIDYENGEEQERFVYLQDHLGSTRMTLNEAGVVVESDLYTAYGEEIDMVTANETTEKFTGKELDKEGAVDGLTAGMGLNYFGWRYYDPVVGMWISIDPKEQFWSGYSYTGNGVNPVVGTDPNGLDFYLFYRADGFGHVSFAIGDLFDGNKWGYYSYGLGQNNKTPNILLSSGIPGQGEMGMLPGHMFRFEDKYDENQKFVARQLILLGAYTKSKNDEVVETFHRIAVIKTTDLQQRMMHAQAKGELILNAYGIKKYRFFTNNCAQTLRRIAAKGDVFLSKSVIPSKMYKDFIEQEGVNELLHTK